MTSDQLQKYKLQLISSMAIGLLLLSCGTWELFYGHNINHGIRIWLSWLIVCFGATSLVSGIKDWLVFSRGKVLLVAKQALALKGGDMTIAESLHCCELWMFCDIPFFYLHGTIQITMNSCTESQIINLRRHSPWLMWWWRSRLYGPPIVWRLPMRDLSVPKGCRIKFNLEPSFVDTIYSDLMPVHDVELVTIFVKSINGSVKSNLAIKS